MACFKRWVGITSDSVSTLLIISVAVRAGGFYVVTIADLRQGLLVLYGESPSALSPGPYANNFLQSS